jgi:hypothetical protein
MNDGVAEPGHPPDGLQPPVMPALSLSKKFERRVESA